MDDKTYQEKWEKEVVERPVVKIIGQKNFIRIARATGEKKDKITQKAFKAMTKEEKEELVLKAIMEYEVITEMQEEIDEHMVGADRYFFDDWEDQYEVIFYSDIFKSLWKAKFGWKNTLGMSQQEIEKYTIDGINLDAGNLFFNLKDNYQHFSNLKENKWPGFCKMLRDMLVELFPYPPVSEDEITIQG